MGVGAGHARDQEGIAGMARSYKSQITDRG
jgi:hypothetical protein